MLEQRGSVSIPAAARGEDKSKKMTNDISDPLMLHHSDHPGLVLVSKIFEGDNYGQWRCAMKLALSAKNKLGFINGENNMVLSWILNFVNTNIAEGVIFAEFARDVWNGLYDSFSQGNDSRIYHIRQEIADKMKALWDELASYHDPITCSCRGIKLLVERQEKERFMQFLMRLNDSFSTIHGSILMMSSLPDTRKVSALILQQERQADVITKQDNGGSHASYQSVATKTTNQATTSGKKHCTYCDMDGHTIERCFSLHGFPLGHKFHGKDVKPRTKMAHNTQAITSDKESSQGSKLATLTIDEYDRLMALIRQNIGNI
ncbi:hypothetical protein ACOSP7_031282 [Xanthoceras sorbifolium]